MRSVSGRVGPVNLKNGFYVQNERFFVLKIFEKSILKVLKRGCRTEDDLSISSLSLAIRVENIYEKLINLAGLQFFFKFSDLKAI